MRKTFFARFSLPILMAFFFIAPFLLQGAHRAIRSNTNKVTDWLPKSFKETIELGWFRDHFVADQFVVISWDGCTLGDDPSSSDAAPDDPRIEALAEYLVPKAKSRENKRSRDGEFTEHTEYFQAVTTARRTLNELTSEPSKVPYNLALQRLQGTLIGPDGHQTCVVVMLSDRAIKDFRAVLGHRVPVGPLPWQRKEGVLLEALRACGINPDTARLGGPPVENVAIDEEGDKTLARLASISGLLGLGLAWWSLRSIRLTLIVFTCGVLSAAAGLAFVVWTGHTTDAVMMAMPSLLYVLAISGAIHLVNYYHDAIREHGLEGAPERALAHGWKLQLLCNLTTGIGLASLAISDLEPIRKFGIYSAVGMLLTLVILFIFLPAALTMWPVGLTRKQRRDEHRAHVAGATGSHQTLEDGWTHYGRWIIRNHAAVSVVCFTLIFAMLIGLTRIHTNIDLLKLFDSGVRVRRDYAWLEEHVGRLVPLEAVVEFPASKQRSADETVDAQEASLKYSYLERLEFVSLVQETIDQELGPSGRNLVGPSLSPVTFAPPVPKGTDSWSLARRSVTNVELEDSHDALTRSGYLKVDESNGAELWRISLRAAAFANLDYGQFVNSVRAVIEPVLAAQRLREHVLQKVVADTDDHSVAGASVCLWERGATASGKPANPKGRSPIQQEQIFANAAKELLGKARLRLAAADVNLNTLSKEEQDAALKQFKTFDCVVAIGGMSDDEINRLTEAGVNVVDSRPMVSRLAAEPVPPLDSQVHAVYTGVVPIVYKAQRALLDNLIESSVGSFVVITPLLMFLCRSVFGGAVAMMPNIFPVLIIFGGMGWLGIFVDIGSMMAASVALGVAVDDTIHFLGWFRDGMKRLGDRHSAIIYACRRAGPPTLQAGLINGLALSVFALSTFTPTQRMGWLMMAILLAGMMAQLFMTPAILAGPLGKPFRVPRPAVPPAPLPAPHVPKRRAPLATSRT